MEDQIRERAEALVEALGAGAVQHLIDRIVIAVRAQDEAGISLLDRQLQGVEVLLKEQARRRKYGGDVNAA